MEPLETGSYEVEMKFPVADPSKLRQQLLGMGPERESVVEQVDLYFAHPQRDFAVTDEAFRLRSVNESNYFTYKGPKLGQVAKTRQEIEIPLGSGHEFARQAEAMLVALGFEPVARVQKTRQSFAFSWQGWDLEAALDDVHRVGGFVELEVLVDGSRVELAQQMLLDLARQLGLKNSERRSYLELLLEQRNEP